MAASRRYFLKSGLAAAPALFSDLRAANTVRVGMIPDAGATQVSVEEKAPLRNYLTGAIGCPVDLIIPTNYNATVEALGNGSLDFAYLGALTYVKAHQRYGVIPMVQRVADRHFHSLFITQTSSSIHKLADLRAKTFAFGDINSTSGHLIPYAEMKQAGIDMDRDLKFRYTGSHPATAKAVEADATDAGALDETVFHAMVSGGKVDGSKVRVFHTSGPFVDYVWVARRDLDSGAQEKFAGAFLALKKGKNDAILEILRGQEFVRANDAEYARIRKIAQDLALL
jgi:phosphonate transport system substrate-binding protein